MVDIPTEPTLKTISKQKHKVKTRLTRKDSRTELRMQRINPEQVTEILDELERDGVAYGKIVG